MASAGIRRRTSTRTGRVSYEVWWRLDDGSQGSKTFARKADASDYRGRVLTEATAGYLDRRWARLRFREWADGWWATWSTHPRRSPNALVMTESRLRRYVRPHFEAYLVRAITVREVQRWQNALEAKVGFDTVMACRSILYRVLQAAEDERIVAANPVRKVPAPKRPVDPEAIFGRLKRRTLTPEEAGILLARFPRFWRDHIITLLGTGLRIGEFAGLQCRRVDLVHARLEVVETRYEAGRYGKGLKDRPKSDASIRELPLPRQVIEAIARQLPPGGDPLAPVFSGRGGSFWRPRGQRIVLSRHNFRRLYKQAVAKAADPASALSPAARHLREALKVGDSRTIDQLRAGLGERGHKLTPRTVHAALNRLEALGLAARAAGDDGVCRWLPAEPDPATTLAHLDLRGPHDLRHTYATWLEEDGIPARVIDELMGHRAGGRSGLDGSAIGRHYRHTTAEMHARVVAALEERLATMLQGAEKLAST
ncbi:MAG TPA: tyrosine-type recombinase/integrase [Actinomycetota bacterium]|jgi:integrase